MARILVVLSSDMNFNNLDTKFNNLENGQAASKKIFYFKVEKWGRNYLASRLAQE